MRFFPAPLRILTLSLFIALAACSSADSDSPQPVSPSIETPLPTEAPPASTGAVPAPTSASLTLITPTPFIAPPVDILPTATPFAYTIKSGDTISQVAQNYGLTVDELIAANPGINTQILSIGQVINIPSRSAAVAESGPTPAPVSAGPLRCIPSGAGMWCLALLENPHTEPLENITARISLFAGDSRLLDGLEALPPLNIIPAGRRLPVAAFFPSRPPEPFAARLDIATAFLLSPGDPRYLSARVDNLLIQVSADGRSAEVRGRLFLPETSLPAREIWLAGVAYDSAGQVAGFRRWQSSTGLEPGQSQTFAFAVYSLDGLIERVEVIVEARP